ncbi:MAG: hypothetical protein AB7Q37_17525 [Pyrinomonadaceae bacterium]
MSTIRDIKATWVYDNRAYVYEIVSETFVANDQLGTIRFELREVDGEDSNLEIVIILRDQNQYHFKTDYYDDPTEELSLKAFQSESELILHYDGRHGLAYFHLILGE